MSRKAKRARIIDKAIKNMEDGKWADLSHSERSLVWVNLSNEQLLFVDILDVDPEWPIKLPKEFGYVGITIYDNFIPSIGRQ